MREMVDRDLGATHGGGGTAAERNSNKNRRTHNIVVVSIFAASGLGLVGCGGSGNTEPSAAATAASDEAADNTDSSSEQAASASDEDRTEENRAENSAEAAHGTSTPSDNAADDNGAKDNGAEDNGDDSEAETMNESTGDGPDDAAASEDANGERDTNAPLAAAADQRALPDITIEVDPSIPADLVVVTAPPTTAAALPESNEGVVFERIDPSPELPGMTRRPVRDAFVDPNDNQVIVVRFGGLICDGFRTVVDETGESVTIAVEGATTLQANEGACAPQLYATELAAVLAEPLGDRTLTALSE